VQFFPEHPILSKYLYLRKYFKYFVKKYLYLYFKYFLWRYLYLYSKYLQKSISPNTAINVSCSKCNANGFP